MKDHHENIYIYKLYLNVVFCAAGLAGEGMGIDMGKGFMFLRNGLGLAASDGRLRIGVA